MMNKQEIHKLVLDMLNDAASRDPAAIHALLVNRVPCNEALADHPHIQVDAGKTIPNSSHVGTLGVINGILSLLNCDKIQAEWRVVGGQHVFKGFGTYGF